MTIQALRIAVIMNGRCVLPNEYVVPADPTVAFGDAKYGLALTWRMGFRMTFLGTGGGRHTTMYQTRSTGGFLVEHDGRFLHVDPGPGALAQMQRIRYDLTRTESVIVSHCHPDHYSDAECVIEGMTRGGWVRRGSLYGSETVIEGRDGLGPALSAYHLGRPERVSVIRPGDVLDVDGMRVEVLRSDHSDPTNVGFRFDTGHGVLSYVSDTAYSEDIADQYVGSRVLLLPVTTPMGNRINYHLCTDDAIAFIDRVRPELAVFVHLGIVMLMEGADDQAGMAEEATGVRTVAARDLMTIDVGEDVVIGDAVPRGAGWIPGSAPSRPSS